MSTKLIERLEETAKTCRKRDPFEAHVKQKLEQAIERLRKLEAVREALGDGPPTKGAVGTTVIAGQDVEMEADWCEYDDVMNWWAKVDEALADCGDES